MTNDLKTLLLLEDKIWNSTPLQDDEYDTVFSILDQSLIKDVVVLAGLIAVNHRPTLLRLIKEFPKYRAFKQQQLYIALGTANYMEAYKFFFELLRCSRNKEDTIKLSVCLAKTHYFIFPLLIVELDKAQDSPKYLEKLKMILNRMGFRKLKPYLRMFPIIPTEWIFRDVFGNTVINLLYKDMEEAQENLKNGRKIGS